MSAELGEAPIEDKTIPVNKRVMFLLVLLFGLYAENRRILWDDTEYMMKAIRFEVRITKTNGSLRLIQTTEFETHMLFVKLPASIGHTRRITTILEG